MIYRQALLNSHFGELGNAGADAYMAVINSGGTPAMAEAASRNASSVQTYSPSPVVSSPPPVIITNAADPVPTRQTTQPVTSNSDPVSTPVPPAVFNSSIAPSSSTPVQNTSPSPAPTVAATVSPLIPNVTYNSSSAQYDLTQVAAGPGVDVPPEYTQQDVVATPTAPAVSSASIPWGLILSASFAAYEFMTK